MKIQRMMITVIFLVLFTLGSGVSPMSVQAEPPVSPETADLSSFETHLEMIRQVLKIPGMSAAVLQDQELVWASGFGYADLEAQVAASPDTPYGLASVTKPVAAMVIMQLVEEGLVDLDAPVRQYGLNLVGDDVTVRHLLTHTSEGIPGTRHEYNGNRYGYLAGVIEGATGKTFAEQLSERVLLPLEMKSTALNPIKSWGGAVLTPWKDFQIALGWGDDFWHYRDVYARMAQPYQLDENYNPVRGMYHLYHNTAAGLVSSVADLAKFDLALDQGLLLGDEAKAEMFAPAVSTYPKRWDLNYGLGWYVQEFEGLQMYWHTGRWPPSTSALYLKIPEEGLTFIVLANTDNLTIPFKSIGDGDVSKSTLVLSFFRHFIYPARYGSPLPEVDWSANGGPLTRQLDAVRDETARRYLERELWSFRQAFASTGRDDQVNKLWRLSMRAFPKSIMRQDPLFTHTVGKFPMIDPTLSAAGFWWLSWGALVWLILVLVSVVGTGIGLARRSGSAPAGFLWLLSAFFLGPLASLTHALTHRSEGAKKSMVRTKSLSIAVLMAGIYTLGWGIAFNTLVRLGTDPHPLATLSLTYFVPFLLGIALYQVPLALIQAQLPGFWKRLSRGIQPAWISNNINFGVMFPLALILDNRVLTTIPGTFSPYFLVMLSCLGLASVLVQYPVQYWMISRGAATLARTGRGMPESEQPPRLEKGWQPFIVSVIFFLLSLVVTITQLA